MKNDKERAALEEMLPRESFALRRSRSRTAPSISSTASWLMRLCALTTLLLACHAEAAISYVQGDFTNGWDIPSAPVTFPSAQQAGDLNVVIIGYGDASTTSVTSVTDTQGNTYTLARGPTTYAPSDMAMVIYYAKNIVAAAANANTVTVTFNGNATDVDVMVAEYSGISTTSPLDGTAGATGYGSTADSGNLTTTNANDLLIGADHLDTCTAAGDPNYTVRFTTDYCHILEDRVVSATGSYNATASTSDGGYVMVMAAFKASTDTQAPTAPTGLSATTTSSSQINVSWTASTDNVGVTGYQLERCQGVSCSTFAQIATPSTTSYSDTGLTAATSYSYRVRATDAAGNLSTYSSTASATTAIAIPYIQSNSVTPGASGQSTVSVSYSAAQSAGNLNIVAVAFNNSTSHVQSVTDSKGNVYTLAVGPTVLSGFSTQSIYYAKNISSAAANANTVTVTLDAAAPYIDVRIAEYGGLDTTAPFDVGVGASGTGTTASSGSVTTTNANDLLFGASYVESATTGPGSGYTQRLMSPDANIIEERVVTTTGSYSATAPLSPSGRYIMQLAAFKAAANGGGDTQAPSAPTAPSATTVSSTQINLSWTASTDNVGVTGYLVERCAGASCTSFTQIATQTTTSYSDTGLSPSTSYSYRVRAKDAANNLSGYSTTVTATTSAASDTQAPTVPGATGSPLTGSANSSTQATLSWGASSDNVGVTGYLIERCQGAGCSTFTQVANVTTTTYNDTGLTPSASYSYRVRATDAANNLSSYSTVVSTTTSAAPDIEPPSTPTGLTATAASTSQINLSWSASTDDVGVTGYLIERCSGSGCITFSQVGTSTTTAFTDIGLQSFTAYTYRVRAKDAANNLSAYSSTASTSTPSTTVTVTYTYDNLKRVTQASSSDGSSVTYTYDANGNIQSITRTSP